MKLEKAFKIWLKLTGRSGGILVGPSIREFFRWYEENFKQDEYNKKDS